MRGLLRRGEKMDLDMKILVVDDFATMRRLLKGSLKKLGFRNFIEGKPKERLL